MYVRLNRTPKSPRRSIQIVEGKRENGKVKTKVLKHVGVAMNEAEEKKLQELAQELILQMEIQKITDSPQGDLLAETAQQDVRPSALLGRPRQKKLDEVIGSAAEVTLGEIVEEKRVIEGIHEVGGHVFDLLYEGLLESLGQRFYYRLRDLVLARIARPSSKHQTQKDLVSHFAKEHSLDSLYALMDKVHGKIDLIKALTFARTRSLFPDGIDLLLFDVTTLYFESTDTDEMREFGYSKDCRFNTTQVVLALATNKEGLPISYELFNGKTAEVSTLIEAIGNWKKLFDIQEVCFVGDRAMMSEKNIGLLEASGYQYVIAAKLKKLPQATREEVLNLSQYDRMSAPEGKSKRNEPMLLQEFEHEGRRLIVSHTESRARKDKHERAALLKKLEKTLGTQKKGSAKKLLSNTGAKRFIKMNESLAMIDEAKVAEESRWDGLHGVISNIKDASRLSLLQRYASLWRIEESFRINKHTLKMRPIFHFKPERIKAHVAICYMAFSVLRRLEYQANLVQKIPVNQIIDTLMNVQASIYVHKTKNQRYRMPGVFSVDARKIYRAFHLERSIDAEVYC